MPAGCRRSKRIPAKPIKFTVQGLVFSRIWRVSREKYGISPGEANQIYIPAMSAVCLILSSLGIRNMKILLPEIERYINKGYEHWHLDKGANNSGKGNSRVNAEHGNRDSDGQLEVV